MQIFEYNGSAIIAMAGKECVAIGSDLRFGVQFQTLATDYKKVYRIHEHLFIGLGGLATDTETMYVQTPLQTCSSSSLHADFYGKLCAGIRG